MPKPVEYRFVIDVFTPDTLPMRRLAEYMIELARLMGEEDRVHFRALKPGSTVLVHSVDPDAVPKVRGRIRLAASPDAPEDIRRRWQKLDNMLADDNAIGQLSEKGKNALVIQFPGRTARIVEIGPIGQEGSLDGILVRIGGEDRSAHAHLQSGDETYICELSRELARKLSPYLYGKPLRIFGRGRWRRTTQARWQLIDFKARDFQELDSASFMEIAERLQKASKLRPGSQNDPIATWQKLRHGA